MKNSSLFSSARPIVFLQNENYEGPFLGHFLVKKVGYFQSACARRSVSFFCDGANRCMNLCFTMEHGDVAACLKERMTNLKQR